MTMRTFLSKEHDSRAESVRMYAGTELPLGATGRIVCPWCLGGSTSERSMAVLKNERGQISWRCFRALCGATGGNMEVRGLSTGQARYFTLPTRGCDERHKTFFEDKYMLQVPHYWRYCETLDRFVFPVLGPNLKRRGVVARAYNGQQPKADTYKEALTEPFIHYAFPKCPLQTHTPIIVLEDIVSAEKIAQEGAIGIALIGCFLSAAMVWELSAFNDNRQVVLALDKDAFSQALKFQAKYGGHFVPSMKVWRLERDIKDEVRSTVRAMLENP